jgi:hypothetical protein
MMMAATCTFTKTPTAKQKKIYVHITIYISLHQELMFIRTKYVY